MDTNYRKRVADSQLEDLLEAVGAVLIEGPKGCGKTTTAEQHANSILYMDDPEKTRQYHQMVQTNIRYILQGANPRLIDEWQTAPELWDAIRFEVDHRKQDGLFMLTGSAVPADFSKINHSGAARFGWLTMRPMSLWESGESSGDVSLANLFANNKKIEGVSSLSINDLAYVLCRGGWPGALLKKSKKAALTLVQEYYHAIVKYDISRVDAVTKDEERTKRIMRSYARNQGTQVSISSIKADIAVNEVEDISDVTIEKYLSALRKIFVIEDIAAWNPNLRSKTAIRTSDTRYYVDPSIACVAVGLGPDDLIEDLNTFGLFFETLCMRDLRVYADSLGGQVYHYRDKNGLECDAVIHLRNGSYGLIEVKLGGDNLIEEGSATLKKLSEKIDTNKMKQPSFMMVLTGVGDYAYMRTDGVMVVPVGCLKN